MRVVPSHASVSPPAVSRYDVDAAPAGWEVGLSELEWVGTPGAEVGPGVLLSLERGYGAPPMLVQLGAPAPAPAPAPACAV
eukprot:SAG11_NODE_2764_length_2999_cov_2.267931_4_plen_81_part_00